jgi:hypothetical protein
MRKFVSVQVIIGILMIGAVAVNAAPSTQSQRPDATYKPYVKANNSAIKDKRIITPEMNARERVEMQRAIKKRAAAKRNSLIQAAKLEKMQQGGNVENPGQPGAQ